MPEARGGAALPVAAAALSVSSAALASAVASNSVRGDAALWARLLLFAQVSWPAGGYFYPPSRWSVAVGC